MIPFFGIPITLRIITVFVLFVNPLVGQESSLPSASVVSKSIAFHDPNRQWQTFEATFYVVQETPNNPSRTQKIHIDLPNERFDIRYSLDGHNLYYELNKDNCLVKLDEKTQFTQEEEKQYTLTCERANMWRNYYTFLYGLPMKLYDPGAHLDPLAHRVSFFGKEYWRVKVTYDEKVGSDVWFFYFNPETFALEAYQFYKGDPEGEGKNTGEYILLSELGFIHGILMPKIRRWFYNKNEEFLGTDYLYASPPKS